MLNRLLSGQSLLDLTWLLFLLVMLKHFWSERRILMHAHSWLIAKARITVFEWTHEGHRLWPKIQYVYQALAQEFQGEHLFLDTSHNNPNSKYARKLAYKVAMAYEHNVEIDVYYNPHNPQQSALDTAIPAKLNLIIVLLLMLILLHIGVIIFRLL